MLNKSVNTFEGTKTGRSITKKGYYLLCYDVALSSKPITNSNLSYSSLNTTRNVEYLN